MTKPEIAVKRFQTGYNCSQAILSTFGTEYGVDLNIAIKISCATAGDLECGAVIASAMVLGLRHASENPNDRNKKEHAYHMMAEFNNRFKKHFGTTACEELRDCFNTSECFSRESNMLFENQIGFCSIIVKFASELLEEITA
ncbi:C-GCAxxG-C-C family protein [bacterium]|nr:C-GCAxxG-C-C family protein [bacterium]